MKHELGKHQQFWSEEGAMASPPPVQPFAGQTGGDMGPLTCCLCRRALPCLGSTRVWGSCGVSSEELESPCQRGWVCTPRGAWAPA